MEYTVTGTGEKGEPFPNQLPPVTPSSLQTPPPGAVLCPLTCCDSLLEGWDVKTRLVSWQAQGKVEGFFSVLVCNRT